VKKEGEKKQLARKKEKEEGEDVGGGPSEESASKVSA